MVVRVDYHNNINLQMNYWPACSTNLSECMKPLIDFIRTLVKPGEKTARAYFGLVAGRLPFLEISLVLLHRWRVRICRGISTLWQDHGWQHTFGSIMTTPEM